MLPEPLDVSRAPPVLHEEVLSLDIPQLTETLHESLAVAGPGAGREGEIRDPGDGPSRLRRGKERHREQTKGECDDAPGGTIPHDCLLGSVLCRLSSFQSSRTLRLSRARKRRVARVCYHTPAPSEPCMIVAPHTAQAPAALSPCRWWCAW